MIIPSSCATESDDCAASDCKTFATWTGDAAPAEVIASAVPDISATRFFQLPAWHGPWIRVRYVFQLGRCGKKSCSILKVLMRPPARQSASLACRTNSDACHYAIEQDIKKAEDDDVFATNSASSKFRGAGRAALPVVLSPMTYEFQLDSFSTMACIVEKPTSRAQSVMYGSTIASIIRPPTFPDG
jgi:hypothetical protein